MTPHRATILSQPQDLVTRGRGWWWIHEEVWEPSYNPAFQALEFSGTHTRDTAFSCFSFVPAMSHVAISLEWMQLIQTRTLWGGEGGIPKHILEIWIKTKLKKKKEDRDYGLLLNTQLVSILFTSLTLNRETCVLLLPAWQNKGWSTWILVLYTDGC